VTALRFDDVWVDYPPVGRRRSTARRQHGLCGVSFALEGGELLAVIGANGAGKTTLLQTAAGVFPPTCGSVEVSGRVTSLVDLSAGFHRELTGRENVLLSAVITGFGRQRARALVDDIAAFSGLEPDVLDDPLWTYSAGMTIRLAFALVSHSEPDVLLVDEVLAVGDESFRRRCLQRMDELRGSGCGIVLATHDLVLVDDAADRVLLLDHGAIVAEGAPEYVIDLHARRSDAEPPPPANRE
jgi:ABC-type polysaccharide/polyol phosphate transport system ATPase subunit